MTQTAMTHWTNVTSGDIFGSVVYSYTSIMGLWFYAIVMLVTMTMIQLKTQNFGVTITMGILISATAIPFMPSSTRILIYVMFALGIVGILYKLYHE